MIHGSPVGTVVFSIYTGFDLHVRFVFLPTTTLSTDCTNKKNDITNFRLNLHKIFLLK